jgi:hypothetical protein
LPGIPATSPIPENYLDEQIRKTCEFKWHELFEPSALDPVVSFLADLAGSGATLELGIGTNRIAARPTAGHAGYSQICKTVATTLSASAGSPSRARRKMDRTVMTDMGAVHDSCARQTSSTDSAICRMRSKISWGKDNAQSQVLSLT